MLNLDEKQLKNLHTKANLKKFMDYVTNKNSEKVTFFSSILHTKYVDTDFLEILERKRDATWN